MIARLKTSTIFGVDALPVEVEVQVRAGIPNFTIIGLADNAVRESRDRVSSALRHSGYELPDKILVNLAPAELRKEGSAFDLAIALGILAASEQISTERLHEFTFQGELSLSGELKSVRGAVALSIAALRSGAQRVVVPLGNVAEAKLIPGLEVWGAATLQELVESLRRGESLQDCNPADSNRHKSAHAERRLSQVFGQQQAKRALQIAAAGSHNLLMIGPPGCGKSMLAQRLPAILPELRHSETLDVVRIHSVLGLPIEGFLAGSRPFRNPHHSISEIGLIGGGPRLRPGEISLAHHGVLFLDEFPEFRRSALEGLRSPMESGEVSIARARGSETFPANFQLIAAMNPCPCGRLGDERNPCTCSRAEVSRYLSKLSQPILDRIDLHVELEAVPLELFRNSSAQGDVHDDRGVQERVALAATRQFNRQGCTNAKIASELLADSIKLTPHAFGLFQQAAERCKLSARAYFRALRVAQTIADLEGDEQVNDDHIAEALSFRALDRLEDFVALQRECA